MTMDVSSLGIEVKSTGIKEASQALSGLGTSAANAETKVNKLTDAVERLLKLNVPVTMQAWAASMNAMANAMNGVGAGAQRYAMALTNGSTASQQAATVTNTLNQQFNNQANILVNLTNNVNNYAASTNRAATASEGWASRTGVMLNTLKAMTAAFLYYKTIELAKSIVHDADEWTNLKLKLTAATGSQNNANAVMEQAYVIAQKMATPLEGTIKLYTRLSPALAQAGFDSKKTTEVVTGLASAFHLGGATTGEMNQAILNFSHSMGGGHLTLRAFNSLTAEAPIILRALAKQMTGGNMDALRTLVSAHKVGAKEIVEAIESQQPAWDKLIAERPVTVEMAITRIKNAWLKAIGEMASENGFNTELAKGITILQDMIPGIVQWLGTAFTNLMKWIDQNQDGLKDLGKQILGILTDVIKIGAGFFGWSGQMAGASGSLEGIAYSIFTIRMGLAVAKDIFMSIAATASYLGAKLLDILVSPFQIMADLLAVIERGVATLFETTASGAAAMGKIDLAKGLLNAASSARIGAENTDNWSKKLGNLSSGMKDFSKNAAKDILTGNEAISKLVNSASDPAEAFLNSYKPPHKYDENANKNPGTPPDPKAIAAADKAWNAYLQTIASLNTENDKLMQTQANLTAGPNALKVGPAQTEYLRLLNEIYVVEHKRRDLAQQAELGYLRTEIAEAGRNATLEIENEVIQKNLALQKKEIDQTETLAKTISSAADAMESKLANKLGGKGTGPEDTLSKYQDQLATAQAGIKDAQGDSFTSPAELANMQKYIDELQKVVTAQERLVVATKEYGQEQASAQLDKLLDPSRAQKFGNTLVAAFGSAGKALGGLLDGFRAYAKEMDQVAKAQAALDASGKKGTEAAQAQVEIDLMGAQARARSYADMAEAAQGFFKKNTEGYKLMGNIEKAYRVAEAAMAIENFALKSGLISTELALTIAGYVKTGLAAVGSAAVQIASMLGLGSVLAAIGVATQAQGDAYSAWARMAAMAATMAALGFAVAVGTSSSKGAHMAADRQADAGTGTTLGDSKKQSESIAKSISLLASNSDIGLRYSEGMLSALQSIQSSLAGTANQILQSGGNLTGNYNSKNNFGTVGGAFLQGIPGMAGLTLLTKGLAGFLGASGIGTKKSLVDSGITAGNQTVGSVLQSGFQGSAYQDIEKQKKAFWMTYSDTVNRTTTTLDPTVTNSFTNIIKNMASAVTQAGAALGMSSDEIAAKLKAVNLSLGDISFKGLTGDQIQKQLEAVFSAFGDKLVQAGLGSMLSKFQQAGEGLLQTAVRVASGVDTANVELSKLGLTAVKFSDVVNTQGDIGAEIVRQSIMLKEAGSGIGDIIQTMGGAATDIGGTYTSLLALRTSLVDLGIAKDVTRDLINAAGGMQAFQSALDSYKKNFFSASEQQAMDISDLSKQFHNLGLQMPTTKAAFRALVDSLSASGATGQALAAKVILLSDAFSNAYTTADTAISNATSDLTSAYNDQVNVIKTAKTAFDGFATSLAKFKTSLITGDLSVLSGLQKYQAEKVLFEETQAKAAAGDQKALADFQQVSQDFLAASRNVNASGSQYTADYNEVLQKTDALQQYSAGQSTIQDQQLAALNQQVSGLITINSSVLTVAQAIANLQAAMTKGISSGSTGNSDFSFGGVPVPTTYTGGMETTMPVMPSVNGSHALGLARVPYDGYIAQLHKDERVLTAQQSKAYQQNSGSSNAELVAELKALKDTVANLREGQREQTAALVAATYDSNAQAADTINEGAKDAVKEASYHQRAKGTLV